MNLTTLTHRDALCLNVRFTSREEAIHALTQRLAALGKISSTEQFLEEVYCRESLGPTALGEGLAVPHGKTAAVKKRRLRSPHSASRFSGKAWMARKRLI
ncbi:hypothetical protein ECZU08_30490 [Escherichia coli]|nr:hypothetical protein ECZU08_30490 [Escherichia coli]GHL08036.1 hypothetical protein ECZU22_19350 [Escherichia coli]